MDQQERERYEQQIENLEAAISVLKEHFGLPMEPREVELAARGSAMRRQIDMYVHESRKRDPHTSVNASEANQGPGTSGKELHDAVVSFNHILKSPPSLEQLAHALLPYLPTNGRVVVEPREYHLKQFCQGEVNRIMAQVNDLSAWQRQVLIFLTAKGALMQKSEILRALTGKSADQTGETYKDKYNEIDQLTAMGYLENRGTRWGSQIRDTVKERLSVFEATDEDIEQTVATILANLK